MRKRWAVPTVLVLVAAVLVVFRRPGPVSAALEPADRLPDLGMAPLTDLSIDTTYPASIALQWTDITGLRSGRYRLTATADPAGWFLETNKANNATWLNLKLTGAGVSVLAHGPAA